MSTEEFIRNVPYEIENTGIIYQYQNKFSK